MLDIEGMADAAQRIHAAYVPNFQLIGEPFDPVEQEIEEHVDRVHDMIEITATLAEMAANITHLATLVGRQIEQLNPLSD